MVYYSEIRHPMVYVITNKTHHICLKHILAAVP